MTSVYHIICLSKKEIPGNSYITDSTNNIIHDEKGRGLSIEKRFIQYTLYVVSQENVYYAIHLSKSDGASFGGKLCHFGHMEVLRGNYIDSRANITHIPVKTLSICIDLEKEECSEGVGKIYLQDDPTTFVFAFSLDGGDERTPNGYAYVNMELFHPITPRPHN